MKATIKVRMNRTAKGAPDSVTVVEYVEGREYTIPEDLAECFFSDGTADPAEAHEPAPSPGHGSGANSEPLPGDGSAPAPVAPTRKRKGRAA